MEMKVVVDMLVDTFEWSEGDSLDLARQYSSDPERLTREEALALLEDSGLDEDGAVEVYDAYNE